MQGEGAQPRGPLHGVRVLDLSRVLAGPYCGVLLADLGADVIRVEHPTHRDEVRSWAPQVDGISAPFAAVNHSKRGVVIDLSKPEGVGVFLDLLATADVMLENFRPGTLEKLGLGRDELVVANPRLIHCAIRAYPTGTAGEALPGYEASMQAHSGVMSVTGENDRDPVRCGVSVIDLGTGMAATIAVLSALRERDLTGKGQYVEPALLRTATNFLNYQIAGYTMAGVLPQRHGSGHEALVPYRNFCCTDGAVLIAAGNDRLWARLCKALALADADGETPFPALTSRIAHRDQVNDLVARAVAGRSRSEVVAVLDIEGIPCAAVNSIAEYVSDLTLVPARVLEEVEVSPGRKSALAGPLFNADFLPGRRSPPPLPGEHTDEVLRQLGYTEGDIDSLRKAGTVA